MDTACIPKYPYFNCFIVPIKHIYVSSFTLVEFLMIMWISNVNLLCQDKAYAMVRRLSLKNFCRYLVKTLSIMAPRHKNIHCAYFVLIFKRIAMYISVVLSNDSCIALNFLSSASTFGREHCACATAYLMCLRCFIHTNCASVGKPRPFINIRYIFHFVPWDHISI